MQRLTASQVKPVRNRLLNEQGGIDPITGWKLDPANIVLDHCHRHGGIRATLGRWNNGVLGKIENWANRLGADPLTGSKLTPWEYLRKIADYLEKHAEPQYKYSHPTFRTEREKMDLKNKRARNKRRAEAKEKRLAANSNHPVES